MATAVDSGRGAVSDMTSMESWTSDPVGGTASDTVGELVAVLAQRRWTEEENAVLAPWYRQCNGLLGNIVISKKFLRTRKIMVMHSNEGRV